MDNKNSYISLIIILIISALFHLLEVTSMFDIHFKTPIVHNLKSHSSEVSPEFPKAKRIMILVVDGGRADYFYTQIGNGKAKFLRKVATEIGVWGISHTRVPTETRPCFVSLTSGFYEDPSNVFSGLSYNAVPFDTVFNHSNKAFGLGGGAAKMFLERAPQMDYYENKKKEEVDFSSDDSRYLDQRTLEVFNDLAEKSKKGDIKLEKELKTNKTSMIYHMLTLEGYGHGRKVNEYLNHVVVLSELLEKFTNDVNNFYGDNNTAFIFTADHGVNDRGGHGDGDPTNTRTPLLAWGAGIRKAIKVKDSNGIKSQILYDTEPLPNEWGLNDYVRQDIDQINLAPLISALIGIDFPTNSVGFLDEDILDTTDEIKTKILYQNLLELLEIYYAKEKQKQKAFFFRPYKKLLKLEEMKNNILEKIKNGKISEAKKDVRNLEELVIKGTQYLEKYDSNFIGISAICAYILWMCYLFIYVSMNSDPTLNSTFILHKSSFSSFIFALLITLLLAIYLYLQKCSLKYYLYMLFPCYFGWRVISERKYLFRFLDISSCSKDSIKKIFIILCTIGASLSLVSY